MKTKKLTTLGLLSAIALTIFMVEAQIPPIVPLPGVKLGLANVVTLIDDDGLTPLPMLTKREVADKILDAIAAKLG